MFYFGTAPFLTLLVCFIGFVICYFYDKREKEKQKIEALENYKKLETQLKEFGADKEDIAIVKQYYPF